MSNKEGLYHSIVKILNQDVPLLDIGEHLSQRERDFHFAMRCNGYFLLEDGNWKFGPNAVKPFIEEFRGQQTSFFGPNSFDQFFSNDKLPPDLFFPCFKNDSVIDVIRKYREIDEDQAARIAFLLGGIVRGGFLGETTDAIEFVSRMALLGEKRSGDAIVSAMAMYVISGGSLEEDRNFTRDVYCMGEAVRNDPVVLLETQDLGLSQVARLRAFSGYQPLPYIQELDIGAEAMTFNGFPTVGAEFHLSIDHPKTHPNFWQRLAILNMSQYQMGSYVQLSRNDRDVIEVRMNPSVYPITTANWEYMRRILPELDNAFFTITINRQSKEDFDWKKDEALLNNLRAIGMLTYAALFENVPRIKDQEERNFGQIYLGQTVKIHAGKYAFTGDWGGGRNGEGSSGQMSIYAGFGANFPYLAYYLSMALANPDIMRFDGFLSKIKTLNDALAVSTTTRRDIFSTLQNRVEIDERLGKASAAGRQIFDLLSP